MYTRDVIIAFVLTLVFMLCVDYLFNEESNFCCLPETFVDYHTQLRDQDPSATPEPTPTPEPASQTSTTEGMMPFDKLITTLLLEIVLRSFAILPSICLKRDHPLYVHMILRKSFVWESL